MTSELEDEFRHDAGEGTTLWQAIAAPSVWAVHFLVVYPGVAVYCAKVGRGAPLDPMLPFVLGATAVALALIGAMLVSAWRKRKPSVTGDDLTFEANNPEERHRFLTHLTIALCTLSIVAVLYTTMPIFFVETCR